MPIPDMKLTNQRIEIIEYLKNNKEHPTVDQVYEDVKKKLTRITKATVYKNLQALSEKGIIKEVNMKGILRFESNLEEHHHLICQICGDIIDFHSNKLTEFALNTVKDVEFQIESTSTTFYGKCKKCVEVK